ncbi:putative monooxygenase [Exidia glandulosa HHB12029]|uniref:Putative monooxygenase n=1 Tax=Exidia glandulosa HHB12029 TaxID=1314781 RepID=A0A165G106_EXIGL|nr:putative monooxygenase [Exidia glandulosa HHB12029]
MSTTAASKFPRIAIIGGGPGGLTLLNVLARHNIPATLYERDETPASRFHIGGTLDLHDDTGQPAMKAAGLWDAFVEHSRPEAEELFVTDKSGEVLFRHAPPQQGAGRPEIDRSVLRQVLLDGAPEGCIRWGHAFVSAAPVGKQWEITFANGHTTTVDLLVGADGARSRVRSLVSDAQLQYTGLTGVELSCGPDVAAQHPQLMARVGKGAALAYDDGKMLAAARTGDGGLRIGAFLSNSNDQENALPDPSNAIPYLVSQFDGWASWLRDLIGLADDKKVYMRSMYTLPVGHTWPHRKGVTLLGDAMNLMSPFAGKGANMAMYAGWQLGLVILDAHEGGDLDGGIAKYEEEVGKVAAKWAAISEVNLRRAMGPNGAQGMIEAFQAAFAKSE